MTRAALLAIAAGIVLVVLWVVNCSGPKPVLAGVVLNPPEQPGQPYSVIAIIENRGPGEGQATVSFRLRNVETGDVYQEQKPVELQRDRVVHVVAAIAAPEGQYTAEAEVKYPPG